MTGDYLDNRCLNYARTDDWTQALLSEWNPPPDHAEEATDRCLLTADSKSELNLEYGTNRSVVSLLRQLSYSAYLNSVESTDCYLAFARVAPKC